MPLIQQIMKGMMLVTLLCPGYSCFAQSRDPKHPEYVLIKTVRKKMEILGKTRLYNVSVVDQKAIDRLDAPLKALATYYSGFAGSDCVYDDSTQNVLCGLTTALGLGFQGSDKQVGAIANWFPADTTAREMIKTNCWVGNPGSSQTAYNDFSYLGFFVAHDTVTVNYRFGLYHQGKPTKTMTDVALIKGDHIVFLQHAPLR